MSKMLKSLLIAAFALLFIACGENKGENSVSNSASSANSAQNSANLEQNSAQNSQATQNSNEKVLRVFGVNPRLTVLLELLYPQGIIGLNYKPYPEDLEFMPKGAESLPVLGLHGGVSFERLVALKPDLVVFMKNTDKAIIEPYERLGIKTLNVSASFDDVEQTLPTLGEALGVQEKASKLLEFARKQKAQLAELRAKVQKKPKIYFAFAIEGLTTECEGKQFDLAAQIGAENVVKCEQFGTNQRFVNMNFEQLISLQPEAIFVREIGLYKELMSEPNEHWQRVKAVQDKKIYYAPSSPSNWVTRPPTAMRIIGYPWAFAKLHPDLLSKNEARQIAQEFFAEFLRPISDEDYERLEGRE